MGWNPKSDAQTHRDVIVIFFRINVFSRRYLFWFGWKIIEAVPITKCTKSQSIDTNENISLICFWNIYCTISFQYLSHSRVFVHTLFLFIAPMILPVSVFCCQSRNEYQNNLSSCLLGPCGGKTTGQSRMCTFFENLGWKVSISHLCFI